jgi:competence protein ComEC
MDSKYKPTLNKPKKSSPYYFRPAIPICLALIGGICAGNWFPKGDVWALGIALSGVALILRRVSSNRSTGKIPLGLFFALGYFSLQPYVAPILPSNHVVNYSNGLTYEITGRVDSVSLLKNDRHRLQLTVETLALEEALQKVIGNLRVTIYGKAPLLCVGDHIRFNGRIKKIRNFYNPGGFDFERYMAFKGIRAATYCRSDNIQWLQHGLKRGVFWGIGHNRSEIKAMIKNVAPLRTDIQAILSALLIGRKDTIKKELRERFNRCGVGHLLAISGLHVGIVTLVSFWLFGKAMTFISVLLWRGIGQQLAALLALVPVFYYGLLAGFSPSTQRAVLMVIILLGSYVIGRRGDIFNTIAWAAVVILILHPPTLFSVSFQLSFTAVLTIVIGMKYVYPFFMQMENSVLTRIARSFIQILLVSIFALLGTLPLTMYYFNQISLLGPFANLILVPLLGFVAVPLGLLAIFVSLISPYLAIPIFQFCVWVVDISLTIINLISSWPWASLHTFTPTHFEIFLYFLFWTILLSRKEFKIRRVVMGGLFFLILSDSAFWTYTRFFDNRLRVTILDVGQGSAALLELPRGKTMLVDGGGFSNNDNFDVGARILAPFLWQKKILTVDCVVLTHPNSDHINGLLYILEKFSVNKVLTNHDVSDNYGYRRFQELLLKKKIPHPDYRTLVRNWQLNQVNFNIYSPPYDFTLRKIRERWRNSNNNSLVIKVSYGSQSLLFTGDLMIPAENELLKRHSSQQLRSTILITPHHGSKSSSSQAFVDAVNPEFAIMAAGWQNPFGFPHKEVLKRYHKRGTRILRTDHCGAIRLALDGSRIHADTMLPCELPENKHLL